MELRCVPTVIIEVFLLFTDGLNTSGSISNPQWQGEEGTSQELRTAFVAGTLET